jgi:predicted NUDIX family NTP pyrophosphohydrolase
LQLCHRDVLHLYCKKEMKKKSAGILVYRKTEKDYEVFLVHPGGPYWAKKDMHAWSIPKGEFNEGEEPIIAAKREFGEETGLTVSGAFIELQPVKQPGGKIIYSWAVESDPDASVIKSNLFEMEWPPGSGKTEEFPEVDKAGWFSFDIAREKIVKGQVPILEQLEGQLHRSPG